MRPKRLERSPKTINLDNDLNEILSKEYPNQASDLINEALRTRLSKQKDKVASLIGSETNAGRLAYRQTMEKMGQSPEISWTVLSSEDQLKFLDIYRKRLIDLQSRGF